MVVQMLSWIHPAKLFFSIKGKNPLTGIWTLETWNFFNELPLYPLSYLALLTSQVECNIKWMGYNHYKITNRDTLKDYFPQLLLLNNEFVLGAVNLS